MQISSNAALKTIDANAISGSIPLQSPCALGLSHFGPLGTTPDPPTRKKGFSGRFWGFLGGPYPFFPLLAAFWPILTLILGHFPKRRPLRWLI